MSNHLVFLYGSLYLVLVIGANVAVALVTGGTKVPLCGRTLAIYAANLVAMVVAFTLCLATGSQSWAQVFLGASLAGYYLYAGLSFGYRLGVQPVAPTRKVSPDFVTPAVAVAAVVVHR